MAAPAGPGSVGWNFLCAGAEVVPLDLGARIPELLSEGGPAKAPLANLGRSYERGRLRCLRNDCSYVLTSLAACFRTFAQRSRCASAIRLRASLLKVRPGVLSDFPPAWPSASSAFTTLPISFSRREYSFRRDLTTLFRLTIYSPLTK